MKIALLTNFGKFQSFYSLTYVVKDTAEMLMRYGHEVHLFVSERWKDEDNQFADGVILEKKMPFGHLKDYEPNDEELTPEHRLLRNNTAQMMRKELALDYEMAITEDFVFQNWNKPYGLAIQDASKDLPNLRWLHRIHSVPTKMTPWWNINNYGGQHKLMYPNKTDALKVAEMYKGWLENVRVIPHIKDLRTWFEFGKDTQDIINWCPKIMSAELVQIYPCSVDRLHAKHLDYVIGIFAWLKKLQNDVCLVVITQWTTGQKQRDEVDKYKQLATKLGLEVGTDIVFTPDYPEEKRFAVGVSRRVVRELQQCSNLFIFPTDHETFGLVLPEASLSGCPLLALNRSLGMMSEIAGYHGMYFDFGSFTNTVIRPVEGIDLWLKDLALIILGQYRQNEALQAKTWFRRKYNMDTVYTKYYAPILAESKSWI